MKRTIFAVALWLASLGAVLAQVVTTKPFPDGPQPINRTVSNDFTTGAATATLSAVSAKWNYLCGFTVTSAGTLSATSGKVTITGTVGGTMSFTYAFVSSGQGIMGVAFPGCISSSATNTAIVVNTPAGGTGTTGSVNAWGYAN